MMDPLQKVTFFQYTMKYGRMLLMSKNVSRLGGMRGMRLSTKREQERKKDHKIINDK